MKTSQKKAMDDTEIRKINRLSLGCQICGTGEVEYRSVGSCRQCYELGRGAIASGDLDIILEAVEALKGWRQQSLYAQLQRDYYRRKRLERGVVDPEYVCSVCDQMKSLFDFPPLFNPHKMVCYTCRELAKNVRMCLGCGRSVELDNCSAAEEVSNGVVCIGCVSRLWTLFKQREERKLKKYSRQQAAGTLKRRGIKPDGKTITLTRQTVLLSRQLKKIKEEMKHGTA